WRSLPAVRWEPAWPGPRRSCLFLALPGADEQRPSHRAVGEAGGVAVEHGQQLGGTGRCDDAIRQRHRQHAAEDALQERTADGERLEAARDVYAVRMPDTRLREQLRQPGAGMHIGAYRVEHAAYHP